MPSVAPVQSEGGFQAVQRVSSLPLVTSAVSMYGLAKNNSAILATSFGAAEAAVRLAMIGANPFIQQFEKPLEYVDKMACQGLDALETRVPVIKQEPAEIFQMTKGYIGQWKGYGEDKVQGSLIYGIDQMDAGLNVADYMVDKILPPVEGETPAQPASTDGFNAGDNADAITAKDKANQVVNHAVVLGEKVKFRVTRTAVIKLGELREASWIILQRLTHALETATEETRNRVRRGSDALKQRVEFDALPLSIRNLAQALVDSLNRMIDLVQRYIPHLDQSNQLNKAKEYASEIYAHITNSALLSNGITSLQKVKEQIGHLQEVLNNFFANAFTNSGLAKFLPPAVTAYAASLTNSQELAELNGHGDTEQR